MSRFKFHLQVNLKKRIKKLEYPNGLEGYLGDEIKDEEFLLKDSILSSKSNEDNSIDFVINWL